MDTKTVLEIIKMIKNRFNDTNSKYTNLLYEDLNEDSTKLLKEYFSGKADAYDEILYHLQSYIEAELSKAEV